MHLELKNMGKVVGRIYWNPYEWEYTGTNQRIIEFLESEPKPEVLVYAPSGDGVNSPTYREPETEEEALRNLATRFNLKPVRVNFVE